MSLVCVEQTALIINHDHSDKLQLNSEFCWLVEKSRSWACKPNSLGQVNSRQKFYAISKSIVITHAVLFLPS